MFNDFRILPNLAAVVLVVISLPSASLAQDAAKTAPKPKDAPPAATKPGAEAKPKPAAASQAMPEGAALNILIRRTLLTVNDANLSGNYSVLRDLAAPGFQQANDNKKLSDIFANLRNSKIDFAPIVYFDPRLVRKPEFTKEGLIRLTGFVATKPQQVNFDMLFENVASSWRLYGIAVNTSPAKTAEAPAAAPTAKSAQPAAAKK
jgi:hypothetical protein